MMIIPPVKFENRNCIEYNVFAITAVFAERDEWCSTDVRIKIVTE